MPIWVRPSSPTVNGCRPSAALIKQPASVRSPAKCITRAIYARSPHRHGSLRPRRSGHASLPGDTPASNVTRAPTPSRAFATRQPAARASSHPPRSIAPFSSYSPLAFPLQNQLFSLHISPSPNPTSLRFHIAPRPPIIAITRPTKELRPWPFSTSG
jgi:hypothetical protein